jgi:hypothetical protein
MHLVQKNGSIFAFSSKGKFAGKVINSVCGGCVERPAFSEPREFALIFDGHGPVMHQKNPAPNPFFVTSWGELFENAEVLPEGTKNIFLDESAISDYEREEAIA